jgi:hypothetical protein
MSNIRGELSGFAYGYGNSIGGSNKMAKSIDPAQTAIAVATIRVATASMNAQFDRYLTVFSDVG